MRLIAVLIVLVLTACKLVVEVPETGRVTSASGAHYCFAGKTCIIEVNDASFEDTFTAIPLSSEYRFVRWKKRKNGLCGGKTKACKLATVGFDSNPDLMAILAPDQRYFLEPVFEPIGGAGADIAELEVIETGKPQVIDSLNRIIGTLQSGTGSGYQFDVRFVGHPQAYTLKLVRWLAPELSSGYYWVAGSMVLYFELANCSKKGKVYAHAAEAAGHVAAASSGVYYIPRPGSAEIGATPGLARSSYIAGENECRALVFSSSDDYPVVEMMRTNLKLKLPVQVGGVTVL